MRYIDRRFLLPVAAATVWAQQPSPAAAEAEAALRARVEQFFQFQVDKKYRQAEALVAQDTKDAYYDGNKFNIKGFKISRIDLLEGNTRAKVTILGRVTFAMPAAGTVDIDAPSTTLWKLENVQWVYYVDPEAALQTPFGKINSQPAKGASPSSAMPGRAPDVATLLNQVKAAPASVVLTSESPRQSVTISNELPGDVDLELSGDHLEGFTVEIQNKHLKAGEKTLIQFTANDAGPWSRVVRILVAPLNTELDIQVTRK
jgi:hypothetical protein